MSETRMWRAIFLLAVLGSGAAFLFQVWSVLIPFVLGFGGAYLVHPLVEWFVCHGFRRDRIVVVLYILLLTAVVAAGFILLPALYQEANTVLTEIPAYAASLNQFIEELRQNLLQRVPPSLKGLMDLGAAGSFRVDQFLIQVVQNSPRQFLSLAHLGLWVFIIPFVSFFSLSQGRAWLDRLFDWMPSEHVESFLGLLAEVNATLGGYIRGQLLDAMCVGLLTMVGLFALGVDGAVLLGVVTGLLNVVPFLAPLIGGGLALTVAYVQGQSAGVLLGIFLLYLVVRLIDDFVFIPFIVGPSVQLHPIVILFSVLAGFHLGGFLGLVFAIPVVAVFKVVFMISFARRRERAVVAQQVYS